MKSPNSVKEALDQCGFDWNNGEVYIIDLNSDQRLVHVNQQNINRLDIKQGYYAVDNDFVYMSCIAFNAVGQMGVFPGKISKKSVDIIEINLDAFYGNDPVKEMVSRILENESVISAVDANISTEDGFKLHIVGSKELPYFVVALTEDEAIKIFYGMLGQIARQAMVDQLRQSWPITEPLKR